jgi:hypothetical protein
MEIDMNPMIRPALAAFALLALISTAEAQSASPLPDPNDPHHVGDQVAPGTSAPMGQAGAMPGMMEMMSQSGGQPGAMMNMGSMMPMMQQMMSMHAGGGMKPFEHVEGRIAFLRAELKITDGQRANWDVFAEAMRKAAKGLQTMHGDAPPTSASPTWIDRLKLHEALLTANLHAVKAVADAAKPLYESFSVEQKHLADELMSGPMGMM